MIYNCKHIVNHNPDLSIYLPIFHPSFIILSFIFVSTIWRFCDDDTKLRISAVRERMNDACN